MVDETWLNKAREIRERGIQWDSMPSELMNCGATEKVAADVTKKIKKEWQQKMKSLGMKLILVGSFFCGFSMFYTMLFGHSIIFLYAFTAIGVIVAFAGLVCIMG